ncbi:MAG: hypothetical protein ACYCSW_08755 [bacterium]
MEHIYFKIGQPSTGKSYSFEKNNLKQNEFRNEDLEYLRIAVSGGIGNEYKGLQNTDLAISYDPINKNLRFGEFLQHLMKAIINPKKVYIIFLDDFHNQDISSLLSEYTPLFKSQQIVRLEEKIGGAQEELEVILEKEIFDNVDNFIKKWNLFINNLQISVPIVPITNRISGESIKLIFPNNFYLLCAANFNEKTINIFADWADRAHIEYVDPLKQMNDKIFENDNDNKNFIDAVKKMNNILKEKLEKYDIFDYEKYCFGIWKIINSDKKVENNLEEQKSLIKFFFSMIKNSLIYNNKNSLINEIGWEIIKGMQDNVWFKNNIKSIDKDAEINKKILYDLKIYES